jgi:ABC-type phosphate/phosphonate transport system substrate-binding protein
MIASLGMYDRPETAGANDRLWAGLRDGLRARGVAAPEALTRGTDAYWPAWLSQGLVFSQTCGMPYRLRLHGQVTLIGSPDFDLQGCPPGHYNSVFVVRKDDPRDSLAAFRGARFAYNEALSQSGWAAPQNHVAQLGFQFSNPVATGGHRLSAEAVAGGRADIASLDALTYLMCRRHDPLMAALREIGRTQPTPALPYIAAKGADADASFAAMADAIGGLTPQDRETLSLRGIVKIPAEAYLCVPSPAAPMDQPA